MKIAMVSEHASPLASIGSVDAGGQNVHVAALSAALAARGHDVRVFTRRDDPDLPDRVVTNDGYVVEHVTAGPAAHVPKDQLLPHIADLADGIHRRCLKDAPDVIHAHFWMSALAAVSVGDRLGVPVAATFHALGSVKRRHQGTHDTSPPSRIRLEQALCHNLDLVLATSTEEVFELRRMGLPPRRAVVVPCGVDLAHFTPDGPAYPRGSGPRLLCVSRLVERKGIEDVVRAMLGLPSAELLVAGGPQRGDLRHDPEGYRLLELARALRLEDRVRFLGGVAPSEVPALMRSADVFVTVPWYEPFGMTALEAMACGRPVIASAVGGLQDTVVDGVTGVLVPPRRPIQLVAAARRLLGDPLATAGMGLAALDRAVSRFSWERIALDHERAYAQMTRTAAAPGQANG